MACAKKKWGKVGTNAGERPRFPRCSWKRGGKGIVATASIPSESPYQKNLRQGRKKRAQAGLITSKKKKRGDKALSLSEREKKKARA